MKIVIKINPLDCKMNKKILIVTEYFYPGIRPDSYLLTEIAKTLSKANDGNIEVICNTELGDNIELDFLNGNIIRLKNNSLSKDKLLLRVLKFILSTSKLGWKTFFSLNTGDKLLSVTNPAFLIVVLGVFKKLKKFEYTLLVYDVFPENLVAANIIKADSLVYKISKKIFDWSYCQTDHLVVIGRDMQELIGKKTNNTIPMSLITNWCDVDNVMPLPKKENAIIKSFNLEDKIVFAFVGNFGRVQGIDKLLEVASLVKNFKFRLLFIGDGAMLPKIKEYIENNPNGKVIYAGSYPSSEQNIFLNACDVAIISLNDSMYGLGVPSKSYYNMAAQKPLFYLGDKNSEIGLVINEYNIGWVVNNLTTEQIAAKIDEILEDNIDIKGYGERAREVVKENFSKEIVLKKYENLFQNI